MKILSVLWLFPACSIAFTGCKKSDNPSHPVVPATPGYTVYIAGYSGAKAVYWKDGVQVDVAENASVNCIAVNGSDVYVGGYSGFGLNSKAAYWKNAQLSLLENTGLSHVYGIAVNGSDVYCAGDRFGGTWLDTAVYWKNGIPNILSSVSSGVARSIHLFGSTIYAAGNVGGGGGGFDSAVVWRNGVQSWYGIPGEMSAVGVSPNDTFFVGNVGNSAHYFTTRTSKNLADDAYATCITFNANDIYIGGRVKDTNGDQAGYWKNDVFLPLLPKFKFSIVKGIAFAGTDLYAVGYYFNNGASTAVCWKNGQMIELASIGEATAIAIVKN